MTFSIEDGGWGWWKEDGNHPFMTAYALWGLDEARRAGVKVELQRISNGARELARLYSAYPRVEPDLKAYEAYVLQRAAADQAQIGWYADGQQGNYSHAAARDELWGHAQPHERVRPRPVAVAARRNEGCSRQRARQHADR